MKYRSDIDGLRTIAVMPVIFYHAGMRFFSGGYVGVDIFFVISGFLITSLIVNDLEKDRFTIASFYVRRIKRIFPALYFLLFCVFCLSFFSLMPSHFEGFGKSVVSTVLFGSNILFWRESGYFDAQAETKPLLHTWSLGVEEQFYIFFPVILMLIFKYGNKKFIRWALGIFIVSLALSIYGTQTRPEAAFYLIPFRAWELMVGALLALGFYPKTEKFAYLNIMSFAGVLMIAYSIFAFDSTTPFPGYHALIPCIGAALIIMSEGSAVSQLLKFKPMVWVGLLSYSLYLWHWPLFALRNYWENIRIDAFYKSNLFLILLTFAFASFSFFIVERPLRVAKIERKKLFFSASFAVMFFGCLAGGYVVYAKGLPGRMPSETRGYIDVGKGAFEVPACYGYDPAKITYKGLCRLGDPKQEPSFVLWGDSHALALSDGIDEYGKKKHVAGILAVKAACVPLLGVTRANMPKTFKCPEFNEKIADVIEDHDNIRTVLLAGRWETVANGGSAHFLVSDAETKKASDDENIKVFKRGLERTLGRILPMERNVYFVMDNPEFPYDVPRELAKQSVLKHYLPKLASGSDVSIPYTRYLKRNSKLFVMLADLKQSYYFNVINPAIRLCEDKRCRSEAFGKSLYMDDNHLSPYGSVFTVGLIEDQLNGKI